MFITTKTTKRPSTIILQRWLHDADSWAKTLYNLRSGTW